MNQLVKTAEGVLSSCLAVKKGEEVLIVTDNTRKEIGEALMRRQEIWAAKGFLW